jgi:hypothetical protein
VLAQCAISRDDALGRRQQEGDGHLSGGNGVMMEVVNFDLREVEHQFAGLLRHAGPGYDQRPKIGASCQMLAIGTTRHEYLVVYSLRWFGPGGQPHNGIQLGPELSHRSRVKLAEQVDR